MPITQYPQPASGGITSVVGSAGISASIVGSTLDISTTGSELEVNIPQCANGTRYILAKSSIDWDINGLLGLATDSGSITMTVEVSGTPVTGLTSLSVTSTPQDVTASGANTINVGDAVTLVFTSNSSAFNLRFTLTLSRV